MTRNKFLFAGNHVRTGADGAARIVNQAKGTAQNMAANTTVKAGESDAETLKGILSAPEAVGGDLLAGLGNRFAEGQKYTTVRRAVSGKDGVEVGVAPKLTASPSYPEVVWESPNNTVSYRLTLDGKSIDLPATSDKLARFKLSGLMSGVHTVKVAALENGKVVAQSKEGKITWLSDADDKTVKDGVKKVATATVNDALAIGNYLDEKGLLVAAMDQYRKYFAGNQDASDNLLRPLLLKTYHELKLKELRTAEAVLYNEIRQQ